MKSKSLQNILRILSRLKLYGLSQKSLVYGELSAYDVGFSLVESKIQELQKGCFLGLSDAKGTQKLEELTGLFPAAHGELSGRKKMVEHRLSLAPHHNNHKGLLRVFQACGFVGNFSEDGQGRIRITVIELSDSSLSMEQIYDYLEENMPAHLPWVLEYGVLTFAMLEEEDITWERWDEEEFTWNTFDTQGETLFKKG